jgi:hypothetical protein
VLPDRQLLVKRSVEPPIALVLAAHKLLQARLPAQDSHVGLSRGERFSSSSRPQAARRRLANSSQECQFNRVGEVNRPGRDYGRPGGIHSDGV